MAPRNQRIAEQLEKSDATIAILQGPEFMVMLQHQRKRTRLAVKSAGHVTPGRNTKEVAEFKRAADAYVQRATSSVRTANTTMVSLGIHTSKGTLTKHYK